MGKFEHFCAGRLGKGWAKPRSISAACLVSVGRAQGEELGCRMCPTTPGTALVMSEHTEERSTFPLASLAGRSEQVKPG